MVEYPDHEELVVVVDQLEGGRETAAHDGAAGADARLHGGFELGDEALELCFG